MTGRRRAACRSATTPYYPGAPMMESIALMPTGKTTGATGGSPPEFSFPADGSAAPMCLALRAMRSAPPGGMSRLAAILLITPAASVSALHLKWITPPIRPDGWASGVKDSVLMLVRPYIPAGPLPEATLDAPATAAIGQPVAIGWTGPAAELDTVEIGLAGDSERWSWGYVVTGNPLELIMPGEPGVYELRYKYRDQIVIATREITALEAPVAMTAPSRLLWWGPNSRWAGPGRTRPMTISRSRELAATATSPMPM